MRKQCPVCALLLLIAFALGCGRSGGSGDTAAIPDTAAIRGAESAPHPPPVAVDSAARAGSRDSAARAKRP